MKKEEVGYVIDTTNDIAKIKIGRHSDCKNCGSCPGNSTLILSAKNPIGAQIGQKVAFETKESSVLTSIYVVYIQPLILVCIGVLMGYLLANEMHESIKVFEIIFGIIFFCISVASIKVIENKLAKDKSKMPTITKIIY